MCVDVYLSGHHHKAFNFKTTNLKMSGLTKQTINMLMTANVLLTYNNTHLHKIEHVKRRTCEIDVFWSYSYVANVS